jgi:hypothetical protein
MSRNSPYLAAALRTIVGTAAIVASMPLGAQVTPPPSPIPPTPEDTSYVIYGEGPLSLPLGIGFRLPAYNRVDGIVLPWGPVISLAGSRVRIDPTVSYRSHIGKVDPFVTMQFDVTPRTLMEIAGGRSTFTNDGWIRSDLVNSAVAFGVGSDSRNYFRADRGWATLSQTISSPGWVITPSVGALTENDWSTGSPVRHSNAPWSFFGRADSLKIRRPNPAIAEGHVSSGLGRVKAVYEQEDVKVTLDAALEHAFDAPPTILAPPVIPRVVGGDVVVAENKTGDFTQITVGSTASFLTFGSQRFDFRAHAVITPGDIAPPQRFAYLGGAGTLATVDLMALGGDRLLFAEGEYSIPIEPIVLPIVGNPIVSLRYAAGAAGVGELPDFIQNLGVGLGVRFLKAEYHVDPNYKKTTLSRKSAFSIGISLSL